MQRGLVQLAWGELLAQETDTGSGREERVGGPRSLASSDRRAAESLGKNGRTAAAAANDAQVGPGELSTSELRSLERNTNYQLARGAAQPGRELFGRKRRPRKFADPSGRTITAARPGDAADPLTWPSRLDAATCYRILGHLEAAERRLDQLDEESPPARTLRSRASASALRWPSSMFRTALALVEKGRMVDGQLSADLDFATLEVYLAAWRAAVDADEKSQASAWQEKAAAVVRDIERDHGPYWRRRGESLFAEQIAANPATTDVAVLAQAAEGFYRAGQPDEALAAFDRAVRKAHAAGQDAKAFELGYAAAAIEQERKNYAAAAKRYRQVAMAAPHNPRRPTRT